MIRAYLQYIASVVGACFFTMPFIMCIFWFMGNIEEGKEWHAVGASATCLVLGIVLMWLGQLEKK